MDHHTVLHDLESSLQEAEQRAEERLSQVHRQLAGWEPARAFSPVEIDDDGWKALEESTNKVVEGLETELVEIQQALTELVLLGRNANKSDHA
ncbi:MAG TPA: hypothetical protein PKA06_11210 [Gemmatales bacterium]|nr:hypothetical protein [Gemmatales bacterium]